MGGMAGERWGEVSGERPGERRSVARSSVLWGALEPALAGNGSRVVLDIGGGTGGLAVRVAGLGHWVTVVDPSPDALASLQRRASEAEVEVVARVGDVSGLADVVEAGSVDVVLCHGVLEVVDDPASALTAVAEVLRPGGVLSLVVAQRHAAVVARAMAGQFEQARELLEGADLRRSGHGRTDHRFTVDELVGMVTGAGLVPGSVHGLQVFADRVPGSLLDLDPGSTAALVELEHAVSTRSEYLPLASRVHLLATR